MRFCNFSHFSTLGSSGFLLSESWDRNHRCLPRPQQQGVAEHDFDPAKGITIVDKFCIWAKRALVVQCAVSMEFPGL